MKKLFPFSLIFLICIAKSFTQTNANQFKWIDGANITDQASSYGASSNGPGARYHAVEWELNGKHYLFGGLATNVYLNDLWVYDPSTNNWTWLKGYNGTTVPSSTGSYGAIGVASSTNLPLGRALAMGWTLNNKLYLMGGTAGGDNYNDLWEYDPITNNWTWIKGSNSYSSAGNYGTNGVEATTNIPGARYSSASWVANGKFYLFGGFGTVTGSTAAHLNDLWSYNPTTNNWTYIKGAMALDVNGTYGSIGVANTNNTPGGRSAGNVWVYNNKLYLMGGGGLGAAINSFGDLNDLWSFDISTNNWTWLKGANTINPSANFGTIGVSNSNNLSAGKSYASTWTYNSKLYLFGGAGSSATRNDLWEYNPATNNWTWLKGDNSSYVQGQYGSLGVTANTNMPGGRFGGSSWVYNNKLYLFGGIGLATTTTSGFLNDLWEYDALTNNFTWLKGRNEINKLGIYDAPQRPGARINAMTWSLGNKFYLFGGYGNDENGVTGNMNDFWEYNPSTSTWIWLNGSKFRGNNGNYGTINVPNASNFPSSRYSANTWTYNNKLYMFGGSSGFSGFYPSLDYSDLWEYNTITNIWTWIKGPYAQGLTLGNYGTYGVEAINNLPGARESATVWTYNNKTYLFGGKYTTGTPGNLAGTYVPISSYLNDLWVYNHTTNNWTWLKGANSPGQAGIYNNANGFETPGAREKSTAVSINGKAYLFGGNGYAATSAGYLNDLWEYNMATNLWLWEGGSNGSNQVGNYGIQGIATNTNIPGSRYSAFAWEFNNKFIMMGGSGFGNNASSTGFLNDLWEYKPSTNMWTWLKGSFATEQGGNYGTQGVYNISNIAGARTAGSTFSANNKLYLFGGFGYGSGVGAGYLNDVWEYTPACTESYSVASGNWNTTSTWFCNRVPSATEIVNICGHTIDLTGNGYAKSVIYNPTGTIRIHVGGNLVLNP